jgi:repressor of nif and glnA expression
MWEALEALKHDLERDHLVGIVAAGSMSRRAYALPVARRRRGGNAA